MRPIVRRHPQPLPGHLSPSLACMRLTPCDTAGGTDHPGAQQGQGRPSASKAGDTPSARLVDHEANIVEAA